MRNLAALAILVPDYDSGLAFFVGTLGFTLIEDTPMEPGKRWVLVAPSPEAPTRLLLARAANERQRAALGNQSGGRVFGFLRVDDFDAEFARLSAAGVDFQESPRHEAYGKVAVFRDPFGNLWDLLGD